ncbi:hypothetical protein AY600_02065 [Phormidium willei BDU 130791]|nr:hypothetical protein AY600_02065 [Phormidium willei BDU 130791]
MALQRAGLRSRPFLLGSRKFNMDTLLLIDGNSVGFAAHASPRLHAAGMETQAVFGFMRTMRVLATTFRGAKPIVFWDGKSWRKEVSADYKANRDDNPKMKKQRDAYKAQRPHISRGLQKLGVTQMMAMNMEADDLIAITVRRFKGKRRMVVISADKDLLQLVDRGVDWYDPIKENRVTHGDFAEYTGYANPQQFVQGKALHGDPSDNLKGVGGIGEKAAPLLLQEFGTVRDFIKRFREEGESCIPDSLSRYRSKLIKFANNEDGGCDRFKENFRLMCLLSPETFGPKPEKLTRQQQPFDAEGFEDFCAELAFNSILKSFNDWTAPFNTQ